MSAKLRCLMYFANVRFPANLNKYYFGDFDKDC
jgi:hypothetical protein